MMHEGSETFFRTTVQKANAYSQDFFKEETLQI